MIAGIKEDVSKSSRRRKRQKAKRGRIYHDLVTAALARAECSCGHKMRIDELRHVLGRWKSDGELALEMQKIFKAHADEARGEEQEK